jgi:hypothetical protein
MLCDGSINHPNLLTWAPDWTYSIPRLLPYSTDRDQNDRYQEQEPFCLVSEFCFISDFLDICDQL